MLLADSAQILRVLTLFVTTTGRQEKLSFATFKNPVLYVWIDLFMSLTVPSHLLLRPIHRVHDS